MPDGPCRSRLPCGTVCAATYTESVTGAFALLHGEDIKVRSVTFRHFTEHIVNFSASKDVVVEDCAGMVWSRDASFAAERNDIASCA